MSDLLPRGLAAVDLGTNTFRLVARGLQKIEYPRIGAGVDKTGRLDPAAIRRGMAALSNFAHVVRRNRLRVVGVVATSAIREADNGAAFCDAVRERFGWETRTISGDEEADLTFRGATATLALPRGETVLVSDVGGGSTELIWGGDGKILGRVSLKLGSVRMTERYRTHGRSTPGQIATLRRGVHVLLKSAKAPWGKIETAIGVGGTATTLAAILHGVEPYDEKRVHGAAVPLDSMEKMLEVLAVMTPRERMFLPSVHKGRADIIVAGTAIQTEIVRMAGAHDMTASDAGILTGLILRSAALARRRQKV